MIWQPTVWDIHMMDRCTGGWPISLASAWAHKWSNRWGMVRMNAEIDWMIDRRILFSSSVSLYFSPHMKLRMHPQECESWRKKMSEWKALFTEGQIPHLYCILIHEKIARPHWWILSLSLSGWILRSIRGFGCSTFVVWLHCSTADLCLSTWDRMHIHAIQCLLFLGNSVVSERSGLGMACLWWRGEIAALFKVQVGCCQLL